MNKLRNVFQRTQKIHMDTVEDNSTRPQQFLKRYSCSSSNMFDETTESLLTPAIECFDLSETEKPVYESWWRDLDPFDLKIINYQIILKFLDGCSLEDNKLEQILVLFEEIKDGLSKSQFFAMLRLIAHAQNGRKINKTLVYLGAPIPHFHTNAIDAIIKSNQPQRKLSISKPLLNENSNKENENLFDDYPDKRNWWDKQIENQRFYVDPFRTAHTPIPNNIQFHNNHNENSMDYFYNMSPNNMIYNYTNNTLLPPTNFMHYENNNSWQNNLTIVTANMIRPSLNEAATITPVTPNNILFEEKQSYYQSHNRSRSAGTAAEFLQLFNHSYQPNKQDDEELPQLHSSRSSLSLHEFNTGQTLLLTQKFVYQSPATRNRELLNNVNNPFNIRESPKHIDNKNDEELISPFDDVHSEEPILYPTNQKPNRNSIPPPPVPAQTTKPSFPKYARSSYHIDR